MEKILASFEHENGNVQLISIDSQRQFVTIRFNECSYEISFNIDSDDDCLKLTHNDGFCEGTSDFTISYPNNEDYESDDRLNQVLDHVYGQIKKS